MNYLELLKKKEALAQGRADIPELTLSSYEQAFEIEYTHNSTAIEGNTLTLIETKILLEDGISIAGKALREIYEQVNHQKAYRFVKNCIAKGLPLDETVIKELHALLMANGFPAISIAKENRLDYFNALEVYAVGGDLTPFADMIADLSHRQLDRYLSMIQ